MLRRIGRLLFKLIPLWSWRVSLYSSLGAIVLIGGLILGLRYYLLPNIESYRGELERVLTRATGQRIAIGSVSADWAGWRPHFSLGEVVVYDRAGRPALELSRIDNALSWLSLLLLEPRFHSLYIHKPQLAVRRAPDGKLSVAGIVLDDGEREGGFADWLFRQREVVIADASISWIDEMRAAPELRLEQVTFRLHNDYYRHRFGLRARAPAELAGLLDVRGDLTGASVAEIARWQGQLYAQLDYVDLPAWKHWVDLPIDIAQGRGAVRAWVDVGQQRVTGFIADVRLADVSTRLAPELEVLDLADVSGRLGWQGWSAGFEVFARDLRARAVAGHSFRPADFTLRRSQGGKDKTLRGELKASVLDLDALAQLAAHLPLDAEFRTALERYAPRGSVHGLEAKWSGDWPPAQYELKARFDGLAVDAVGALPGLSGISGTVAATEKRGTMTLANRGMQIALPRAFAEPLAFDQASGQIQWTASGAEYDVRLGEVKFSNTDLAGTLHGSYHVVPGERGVADLTGALTRADARAVARYLPVVVGRATRDWLQSALVAGHSNDVKLRLKGNLADFPFDRAGKGLFQVTAKARDGVLRYASGWPRIENIAADLNFIGGRMEVRSSSATILGAQLSRVLAVIPDLVQPKELLEVSGEADAPTSEFLRFIAESPVGAMIERFTDGMEAQGSGRLGLKLHIPLRALGESRVAGSFQFLNNRLRVDADLPPLEQVNGRLEFTEASVRGQGIAAQVFGGPALINVSTQEQGVAVTASGRANVDQLKKRFDHPLLQAVSGTSDWRSSIRVRAKQADFRVESGLQGITSTLPAPLAKAAGDTLPLRFERRIVGEQQDQIEVGLGNLAGARIVRRRDGAQFVVERAAIGLGTEPPAAEAPGLWLRGELASLDLDSWRGLLGKSGLAGPNALPLAALDLKLGSLDALGRRFTEVALSAREQTGNWRARISARELAGEIGWRPEGKGQIVARLQRLALPAPLERLDAPASAQQQPAEYPALDLVVEDFHHKARALGRLELLAVPDGRNWLIERLHIRNADGQLSADGTWQWQARIPHTQMNFRLEVGDIGKFLARMGYAEGVKGGTATLGGTLTWTGAPQDLDYPSLAGNITVEARRGQFAKLEPGIGKLLGILNLQALPRRVALDFKDVFSEGFSFDTIGGTLRVQRGIGTTDGFRISGPSAKIVMSGEVDLVRETQKLRVRVTPIIGDSVAAATALLGGPVAGLGVFLAQRLLNDPLGQLIAYDYAVTGTWSDPAVNKIALERAEPG
ncbi:MAG: TIGR02099 family protein [Burkholderiales bacterium]|nr:TIGR02099 family protein [Burkholderiales bacterium]